MLMETERLILRPFTMDDAEALHREIYSDLDVLTFYNGGRLHTLEEVRQALPKRFGGNQFGYWAVTRKADEQLLGQVHLDAYVNAGWYEIPEDAVLSPFQSLEAHLGFAFGKRSWGSGYATEACRAVVRYAFSTLRLKRLLGGANTENHHALRLHRRLGYRLFPSSDGTGMTAVLDNPLTAYAFRAYQNDDRTAAGALGTHVINGWHAKGPDASLHLVAVDTNTSEIVGHVQAVDQGVPEPSRRPGQCHFSLDVAPAHRRRGIGGTLIAFVEAFARRRGARLLYTAYGETETTPAAVFLSKRGFVHLERFCPSYLDLEAFDPAQFSFAVERVQAEHIRLETYASVDDSPANRRKLYELEQLTHATQPFREVEPYLPEPWEKWEQDFIERDPTTIFLAVADGENAWVGVVTGLDWGFTGVHPDWRNRGIATALKVKAISEAKKRGMVRMETENHGDNAAMLKVNRTLGFVFTTPEVACVKRF